jgi:hypothetical protein
VPLSFATIQEAFPNHAIWKIHDVVIRKNNSYSVAPKGSPDSSKKIYLGTLLHELHREVHEGSRSLDELKIALGISSYFADKLSVQRFSLLYRIQEVFQRILNFVSGYGFETHYDIAYKIRKALLSKEIKPEEPALGGGFVPANFWQSMAKNRPGPTDSRFKQDPIFSTIEANFTSFCKKLQKAEKMDYSKPPENSLIPPIIHFIWLGSKVPEKIQNVIDTWKECHPGWTLKIWTDNEITSFPWQNREAFDAARNAKCWAEAADIWRYEILYQEGGIYSDTDVVCFKSFNDLITHTGFFAGQETNTVYDKSPLYVCNAVIGSKKGCPVMKTCMDNLVSRSKVKPNENPRATILNRTGPILLTNSVKKTLSDETLILPCSYVYPLPYFTDLRHKKMTQQIIRSQFVEPESLAVHLWDASW